MIFNPPETSVICMQSAEQQVSSCHLIRRTFIDITSR